MIDLRLGDCLDILPTLPDASMDAIITDLPYGTTACSWDSVIPFKPMWVQVKRLLKPRGVFITTASQPFTSALVMSNPKWFRCEWIWRKSRASNFANAKYSPLKYHEEILVFSQNGCAYNPQMIDGEKYKTRVNTTRKDGGVFGDGLTGYGLVLEDRDTRFPGSVLDIPSMRQQDLDHPTQKPVALYEYLIRTYTNEGDTVLDFCAGSGTTGIAAINTGRNCILIEKEPKYYEIAQRRIAEAQAQPALELAAQ